MKYVLCYDKNSYKLLSSSEKIPKIHFAKTFLKSSAAAAVLHVNLLNYDTEEANVTACWMTILPREASSEPDLAGEHLKGF